MSVDAVIEEYIYEMARAVGDAYTAIADGIGNDTTPGSALFEMAQIKDLAKKNIPHFAVLETTPAGFTVTDDDSTPHKPEVTVSAGTIGYNGNQIYIKQQQVRYSRDFASDYPIDEDNVTEQVYGVCIGIPISEAAKVSTVYSATVQDITVSAGSHVVTIDNIDIPIELGFPLQGFIGSEFVVFTGADADASTLQVDTMSDGLVNSYGKGTVIYFIYEPKIRAICGLPVGKDYQAGRDVIEFAYFPPIPSNWLPIAKFLVEKPSSPKIVVDSDTLEPAINNVVVEWPFSTNGESVFSKNDAATISLAINKANAALKQIKGTTDIANIVYGLQSYTSAMTAVSGQSFAQFWADRPFKTMNYFARGSSFEDLERFEFPNSFIKAYYDTTGKDLQHTFAIFRGDIYQKRNISWLSSPSLITPVGASYTTNSVSSVLRKGTYLYSVSATSYTMGETEAEYVTINNNSDLPYVNEITGDKIATAAYYHIYRRASSVGEQIEYRLTPETGVPSLVAYDSSESSLTYSTDMPLEASKYYGIGFNVTEDDGFSSGLSLKIKTDTTVDISTLTGKISVSVYKQGSGQIGSKVADGTYIYCNELADEYQDFISLFDGGLKLDTGSYFIVISIDTLPGDGNVYIQRATSGVASSFFTTSTSIGSAYASSDTNETYYKFYGFVDTGITTSDVITSRRGVKLTGKSALKPTRIRVRVPSIDSSDISTFNYMEPLIGADGTISNTDTSTKNEVVVTVTARNSNTGATSTFTVTVPKGSERNWYQLLGDSSDLFDIIDDVQVKPSTSISNLSMSNGQIKWSIYDLITIESVPS